MNCNLIKCDVYKQDGQTFYFFYIEMENGGVCRIVYLLKCNEHPGVLRSFVSCSLFFCLTDKLLMLTNGGRFMDGTTAYHTFDRVLQSTISRKSMWNGDCEQKLFYAQINCTLSKQVNQSKMLLAHVLTKWFCRKPTCDQHWNFHE